MPKAKAIKIMIKNISRALRLPFITASILPFIFGSLIVRKNFNSAGFTLGLLAAIFTHLSANLINDYFDSRSGVDWLDKNSFILLKSTGESLFRE